MGEASLHGAPLEAERSYIDEEEHWAETIEIIAAGIVTVDEHDEPV